MTEQDKTSTRRQWITTAARWTVVAAIAAAWLRVAGRKTSSPEQACVDLQGRIGCRKCGLLADCGLPRALSLKQFLAESPGASDGMRHGRKVDEERES